MTAYLHSHPDTFVPYIQTDLLSNPRRYERAWSTDAVDLANRRIPHRQRRCRRHHTSCVRCSTASPAHGPAWDEKG